jgi:hypothetical protein
MSLQRAEDCIIGSGDAAQRLADSFIATGRTRQDRQDAQGCSQAAVVNKKEKKHLLK